MDSYEGGLDRVVDRLRGGVVVSCQANGDHPMARPEHIAALARCAERGGAVAVRIDGAVNVATVAAVVTIPILGIAKVRATAVGRSFITPTFDDCRRLVEAGAALVAVEATTDLRKDPDEFADLCAHVHAELAVPVMADVSTFDEGLTAADASADLVATTLSGYTSTSPLRSGPDLNLVDRLAQVGLPVVLEGRVGRPDDVSAAFARGAWSVVVGTAITDPVAITRGFVEAATSPATSRAR